MQSDRRQRFASRRSSAIAALSAGFLGSLLIIGTYPRLSHTWDEPTHVAAGLEWLQTHHYRFQTENPPLSRVVLALVPYLSGVRATVDAGDWTRVPIADIFYRDGGYVANVTRARVANLVIFWLVLLETWWLSGGSRAPILAASATALVATLPALVAHAGLATTDVSFVAAFLAALLCWRRLVRAPRLVHALAFGVALGVALGTKFSTIPFLPPVALVMLVIELHVVRPSRRRERLRRLGLLTAPAVVMSACVVWAIYGFHVGRLSELPTNFGPYGEMPANGIVARLKDVPLPAHEFIHGLLYLRAHGEAGHRAFLMGETSQRGFWLFYPVALLVKTPPLTLLLMLAGGAVLLTRVRDRQWATAAGCGCGAVALLCVAVFSPLNLGIRHVIVVYPLLAIAGIAGLARLLTAFGARRVLVPAVAFIVAVQAVTLARSFPNQLAYFNAFAGRDPGWVLSDSDLDWGQDVLAVERFFASNPVDHAYLIGNGSALWCRHQLPPLTPLPTNGSANGWIVVFERPYRLNSRGPMIDVCGNPVAPQNVAAVEYGWLDWLAHRQETAHVGAGVRIYRVAEPTANADSPLASSPSRPWSRAPS